MVARGAGHLQQQPDTYPEEYEDAEPAEEVIPLTRWQRLRPWLVLALVFVILATAAYLAGEAAYNPASRIPELQSGDAKGLLGPNSSFLRQREAAAELLESLRNSDEVALLDETYELDFPRTLADRLFGERDERATVSSVEFESRPVQLLVLWEGENPRVLAIARPGSQLEAPEGFYMGVTDDLETPAIKELLQAVEDSSPRGLSHDDYVIFGPFAGGRDEALKERIDGNRVLRHLSQRIEASDSDVSLVAPAFLLRRVPDRGTISALYIPLLGLVQEPLWGRSATSSLAHELVHAYIDRGVEDESALLSDAADYLDETHPRLYGQVVSELYESLDAEGRAEEAIAFLTGAIASGDTKTEPSLQVLENQGRLSITEDILFSDIRLLVEIGLLPQCMQPDGASPDREPITFEYYESAESACD